MRRIPLTTKERREKMEKYLVITTCKACSTQKLRQKFFVKVWDGLCMKCHNKELSERPDQRERQRQLVLLQIKSNGGEAIGRPFTSETTSGKSNPLYGSGPLKIGDKNPNWRGGVSTLNRRLRGNQAYRNWKLSVYERDGFTCQICHEHNKELHAHHIKPWAIYPNLRYDVDNGQTLCIVCHRNIHKQKVA